MLSRNTFYISQQAKKAAQAVAYFCHLSQYRDEEKLTVTSPRTISMRYKSCEVNSFSQEFPKFVYIKIVIKMLLFFKVYDRAGDGGGKMINYLLVATAVLKIFKIKIKILIKKEKRTDDAEYAAAFSASITSRSCRKNI